MKRGSIVIAVGRGDFSGKPRPSLVLQADAFSAYHPTVTVCPITSELVGGAFCRVPLAPTPDNGLMEDSEVEIDLMQAVRIERIRQHIGEVGSDIMTSVDQALRRWLAL